METGLHKKIEKCLFKTLSLFKEYCDVEKMAVFLTDKPNNFWCWSVTVSGIKESSCSRADPLTVESIIKKEMILIEDTVTDVQAGDIERKLWGNNAKTVLCFPLIDKKNVPFATIELIKTKPDDRFTNSDFAYAKTVSDITSIEIESLFEYQELKSVFIQIVRALTAGIDAKDPYCQGHSERVCKYALMIAEGMDFDEEKMETLELAALLHDIGKLGVPEEILNKQSKLTDDEWAEIKKHPTLGAAMISHIKQLENVVLGVRYHQERFDGQGYPEGLWGDNIPLTSRIIAVADTFDAMTSDRPYRKRFPDEIALGELHVYSGLQFDPRCVESFLRIYERLKRNESK